MLRKGDGLRAPLVVFELYWNVQVLEPAADAMQDEE